MESQQYLKAGCLAVASVVVGFWLGKIQASRTGVASQQSIQSRRKDDEASPHARRKSACSLLEDVQEQQIDPCVLARLVEEGKRELLPKRIILMRHGESEGNVDKNVYRSKGDNLLELTDKGSSQANEAGKKLAKLLGDEKVLVFCSPFQRAFQTLRNVRTHIESNIIRTEIEASVREQEFGNLQGDAFASYRKEQEQVGRFFYRFPTGESSADVYERVAFFWNVLLNLNTEPMQDVVENVLVVTHGLTIRLLLMQLYKWSPDTFETVYNLENCEYYVLEKESRRLQSYQGRLPYGLSPTEGATPRSERRIKAHFKDGSEMEYILSNYLSIPQPRTSHKDVAIRMLAEQHGFHALDVAWIDFFVEKKFAKYR